MNASIPLSEETPPLLSTSTSSSTTINDSINLLSSVGLIDATSSSSSVLKQALLEQQAHQQAQFIGQSGLTNKNEVSTKDTQKSKLNPAKSSKSANQTVDTICKPKSLLCPLCQEGFNQRNKLESHLMEIHNVNRERVDRLMLIVDQAGDLMAGLAKKEEAKSSEDNEDSSSNGGFEIGDGKSDCSGDSNSSKEDCIDQKSNKYLKTSGDVSVSVSDRHVYKYRCNQCSLAFKTMEKLYLHSQYHLIRAATQCVLCLRSFRSFEALQKHVETSHQDMTEEELEAYRQSLANNPLLLSERNGGGILDPSTTELLKKESNKIDDLVNNDDEAVDLVINTASINNVINNSNNSETAEDGSDADGSEAKIGLGESTVNSEDGTSLEDYLNSQSVAEDNYNDPNRKYKCHRCKVAFTRQSYLTSHNKTLLHRKGEKLSYPMEKYLDPNRPYKCDICKESFTQKNILLVHYNSVSHLHKLKQAQNLSSINSMNDKNSSQLVASATSFNFPNDLSTNGNTSTVTSAVTSSVNSVNNASSNDYDKKPYRCNICKVGYNVVATLDIHIRSVLHQTRASKLHDLAISGQIDLSQPLIEHADNNSTPGDTSTVTSANLSASLSPKSDAKVVKADNSTTSSPSSTPKIAADSSLMALTGLTEQELQQQAVALNLAAADPLLLTANQTSLAAVAAAASASASSNSAAAAGLFPCSRCNAIFPTQEASLQHQQLCCLFGPSAHTNVANLFKNSSALTQQAKELLAKTQVAQDQLSVIRNQTKYYNAPVCRSKPPVYKHLLETWGFEIVMQFNEYHQRKKRIKEDLEKKSEKQETENVEVCNNGDKSETAEPKAEKSESDINLPEINRSKCEHCNKEFSSIWVLKAHKEEIHKKLVTLDIVEQFANEYRKDYDKRLSINSGEEEASNNSTSEQGSKSANSSDNLSSSVNTATESVNGSAVNTSQANSSTASNVPTSLSQGANNLADMSAASQMAAQLQFSQLLMSMGLAGIGMPMGMNVPFAATAMGLHPPMIPLMMAPHLDPVMAAAFNHSAAISGNSLVNPTAAAAAAAAAAASSSSSTTQSNASLPNDPNFFAAQQKMLQQQHQISNAQQQKRARTRITDDQLKILRQYFDINNSPTEEALQEMSEKSGLPLKVIKHWFRNTLFKERQRNKDSPYNFNNPPSTFLNLEEYEKTGEAKVIPIDEAVDKDKDDKNKTDGLSQDDKEGNEIKSRFDYELTSSDEDGGQKKEEGKSEAKSDDKQSICEELEPGLTAASSQAGALNNPGQANQPLYGKASSVQHQRDSFEYSKSFTMSPRSDDSMDSESTNDTSSQPSAQAASSIFSSLPAFASAAALGANPLQLALDAHRASVVSGSPSAANASNSLSSSQGVTPGKRANRTRFTDYQIKVLQEFFESNAYPKDDDLEYLSKLLNLSPRVIVVWFQNARQKARKVYENQPPVQEEEQSGKFQRTPGLNYQCKKCMQVFQRYYELIKHQKSSCFKDENPLAIQIKAAQEARQTASCSPEAASSASSTGTPVPSSAGLEKPSNVTQASATNSQQSGAFRCEKCSLVFPRFDLWREHQLVHLMNPNLFSTYPPRSPFGLLHYEAAAQQAHLTAGASSLINPSSQSLTQSASLVNQLRFNSTSPLASGQSLKRKLPEDEDSHDSQSCSGSQSGGNLGDQPRDKRLRTTILPEQLDYLYQKYQIESNPSRKMLENIAKEVGLKKRVVQVWFQNTRARERKGQFRAHQQVIHKRCPFCRALFKARSALESHLATRHADQYTKGDINIDALPDGDPSEDQAEEVKSVLTSEILQNQMKQYYSLKKYIDEMNLNQSLSKEANLPPELTLNLKSAIERGGLGELPLDLSKPVDLSSGLSKFCNDEMMSYDNPEDSDSAYDLGGDDGCSYDSASNALVTSPGLANNCQLKSSPSSSSSSKRFRTQMTPVQLKVGINL